MADSKSKAIPQWQRQKEEASDTSRESINGQKDDTDKPQTPELQSSRAILFEQATKFLDNDDIRNSSIDQKINFLESKGLSNEEIQTLLGVSGNEDPTRSPPATQAPLPASQHSTVMPESAQKSSFQSSNIPPIITYPEFLLHSQKPPPLITAQRLLTTLYLASGAATIIYGTSQYLVSPMLESLNSARHSLFKTASSSLDNLNEKLEIVVSIVPDTALSTELNVEYGNDDDGNSSIISDPAELFHRDFGTQTSLPSAPSSPSSTSSTSSSIAAQDTITSAGTRQQVKNIQALQSRLSDFLSSTNILGVCDEKLSDDVNDVRKYLDGLAYGRTYGFHDNGGVKLGDKDDEIAKVRAEIRGVKGVLLNAKSFPAGGAKSRVVA